MPYRHTPERPPLRKLLIKLLAYYKRWLSPLLGPRCRYYPSCSSYAQQAIGRYGVVAGGWMTMTRLLRCSPLSDGGYDPLPDHFCWWRGPTTEPTEMQKNDSAAKPECPRHEH